MSIYKYKAIGLDGKMVNGLVEAGDENSAAELLRDKGLTLTALRKNVDLNLEFLEKIFPIKPKDVVIFSRQFSVLVSANVALVHSLKLLVEQVKSKKFKKIIAEIASDVDGGARLSDSLAKHPEQFSSFYTNVVRAGETSGKLDEVLSYLADELEKDYDMNSKIKGAMIYPAVVVTALVVIGAIMMIFVVPKLTEVISTGGGGLPLPTKILIAVSDFLQAYWWLVLLGIFGAYASLKVFVSKPAGKMIVDTLLLKLPIFGNLYKLIYVVRFTRSMSTLIFGGVSLSRGLAISAEVVSNFVYKKIILDTKKEVENGNSISSVFMNSKEVPIMVSQMMAIGEKTGRLDTILNKITDFYTREINNIIANLMTLMEPIIIIIIGIGVGTMVAAIILPMYQMADVA